MTASFSLTRLTRRHRITLGAVVGAVVLVTGIVARILWIAETQNWQAKAETETRHLSVALHEWFESSFQPLSGLAALMENNERVSEGPFVNAVEGLEARATAVFMIHTWLLSRGQDNAWAVKFDSARESDLNLANKFKQKDALAISAQYVAGLALTSPNEWSMSAPVAQSNGSQAIFVALASTQFPDQVLLALVDTDKLITNFLEARVSPGMTLTLALARTGQSQRDTLYVRDTSHAPLLNALHQASLAGTTLEMNWQIASDFNGGPRRSAFWVTVVTGGIFSLLAYLFLLRQLAENELIQRQVNIATQELREERGRLQAILDTAPVGIAIVKDSTLQYGNPYLLQKIDFEIGADVSDVYLDPAQRQGFMDRLNKEEFLSSVPTRMRGRDGTPKDVMLSMLANDYSGEREIVGWVVDVTDLKNTERQLQIAMEKAEDATRSKSDFLANMSHEIRTPLNAVIGMSHLVLSTNLNPKQRDYIRKIQLSGRHLLGLINDILDFSKIEAGKLEVEHIEFDLDSVLENVSNIITEKCTSKGLELIFDVDPVLVYRLIGDPLRLGQILINYANNAVKFTEQGEIVIRIKQVAQEAALATLRFEVKDTGIGLSREQQTRLFQSFQQADTSITRKHGGTGLGLAISKRLAELMGGEVGVVSKEGTGSMFWFTAKLQVGSEASTRNVPALDIRSKRVLVVDDNDTARHVMAQMLREMTFIVEEVSSGAEAIQLVSERCDTGQPFDIAFLDWQMPGMDGIEVARQFAKLDSAPIPILVTAFGREEFFKEAESTGIQHALVKPVNSSVLFDTAMQALSREAVAQLADSVQEPQNEPALLKIRGAKVLLVDDNELNQQFGFELLTSAGFAVDLADNGQMALDMLIEHSYHIVLMDMQMPVMDGVTATKAIRANQQFHNLPVLAMTANAMASDRELCLAAGMNDYITKPIDPALLYSALIKWVSADSVAASEFIVKDQVSNDGNQDAALLNALKTVEGLDVTAGMNRSLNNLAVYKKLLNGFLKGSSGLVETVQELLHQGDLHAVERAFHTLKGTAATIGATDVSSLASDAEILAKRNARLDEIGGALRNLEQPLLTLINALSTALSSQEIALELSAPGKGNQSAMLKTLIQFLVDEDPEAVTFYMDHQAQLDQILSSDTSQIATALTEFRLDDALRLIQAHTVLPV